MTLRSDPVTWRTTLSIAASPRLSSLLRTARRASPVGLLATASHGGSSAKRHVAMAALGYVAAIGVAELVTTLGDPRAGVLIHTVILSALILHAAFVAGDEQRGVLLSLCLAPLIRILSLSMPLENIGITFWYVIVSVPLLVASAVVARTIGLTRDDLGLRMGSVPTQLLVGCSGLALGPVEYLILKPDPLIDQFSAQEFWLPALILLIGTGFTEEMLFRGLMQSAARGVFGGAAVIYVSVVFAVLHIGYQSVLDVSFVFGVSLFFCLVVTRTRSILGVTLSHGITNILLFLVVPFI